MQFALANPEIATTLVGSSQAENIENNVKWMGEPMDEALLRAVEARLAPVKNRTWPSGRPENA